MPIHNQDISSHKHSPQPSEHPRRSAKIESSQLAQAVAAICSSFMGGTPHTSTLDSVLSHAHGLSHAKPENDADDMIDQTFQTLNNRHSTLYDFVMRYSDYIYAKHDYGNNTVLSMIEVHTLTYIEDNPGTRVTELARYWHKTKGALSQIVTKLEGLGLIRKVKSKANGKHTLLYVTDLGTQISRSHKLYDIIDIAKTLSQVQQSCTAQEVDTFFKVLKAYLAVIDKDFEQA